ncbi:MAG: hypothetical protein JO132_13115 [Streptosporangiaceae bacterium]|nr:hypothetical protein [Streptosporangiaceae bacterium]
MKRSDTTRLVGAITAWAQAHPTPDVAVLAFGNGLELTPRQIASHMQKRDEVGQRLFRIFESASDRIGIEEVVDDLLAEAERLKCTYE